MTELLIKFKNFCLDLLFPPVCLVCRRRLDKNSSFSFLCFSCSQKIQINTGLDKKTGLAAAAYYCDEILRQLIFILKYQKIKTAAVPLAEILSKYIKNLEIFPLRGISRSEKNYYIVPIPLHRRREKERGFNQSSLIAEQLSKITGLPILKNVLKRIKNTPSQVELKEKKKREMNVRGCFAVVNSEFLAGKNIIVLDDVSTSGATMREAIKTLKNSGANKILGLAVAKV